MNKSNSKFKLSIFVTDFAKTLAQLILLLLAISLGSSSFAQSLNSTIRPTSGTTEDIFLLTITLDGPAPSDYPSLAGGDEFDISFLGTQKSIQIVNGTTTQTTSFQYQLRPKKHGQLLTPSATLGALVAPAKAVIVKEASKDQSQIDKGVSVTQSISPKQLFVGQQAVLTLEMVSKLETINLTLDDQSLQGFWQVQFPEALSSRRRINNEIYDVRAIRSALFPLKEGQYTIPKSEAIFEVRMRNRSAIDLFNFDPFSASPFSSFGGATREVHVWTEPLSVNVKPLPNGPADIVGLASLQVSTESAEISAGKSFTVSFTLVSDGNLDGIKSLKEVPDPAVQVFWDKPTSEQFENQGRLFTRKTFKASVLGITPGLHLLNIEPIKVFDPYRERYRTVQAAPIIINIAGDGQAETSATPTPTNTPVSVANLKLDPDRKSGYSSAVLLFFACSGLILSALAWMLWKRYQHKRRRQSLAQLIISCNEPAELVQLFRATAQFLLKLPNSTEIKPTIKELITKQPSPRNFQLQTVSELTEEVLYSGNQSRMDELRQGLLELLK